MNVNPSFFYFLLYWHWATFAYIGFRAIKWVADYLCIGGIKEDDRR